MPREYAKNWFSMWTDEDFCTQPIFDKLLWNVLLGQPPTLLNYCGVQPISMRRWRKAMRDGDQLPTELDIKCALIRMERRGYVYTDDDTGEILIRSFMRRDEVVKQPNVMLSALRAATFIESPKLAAVLLAELVERIALPEITGTSEKAEKLRQTLKRTMKTAVDHLTTLSTGVAEPLPEPFSEDFPEGFSEPLTEGLPRPAEMEPFPEPFPEGIATGLVEVEVEVSKSPPVVGQVGEKRDDSAETGRTASRPSRNGPPPDRCSKHRDDPDPPNCRACAAARVHREKWETEQPARRAQQRAAFWTEVHACTHCDEKGWTDGEPTNGRCPQHDWTRDA